MQNTMREFNGIFQAECHTSSNRLLWVIFLLISLCIVAYGAWAVIGNHIIFSENARVEYVEITLAIVFFLAVPIALLVVGTMKISQKSGLSLKGVRIADNGVEIGRVSLQVPSFSPKEIWEKRSAVGYVFGEWKKEKQFNSNHINVSIVLRERDDPPQRLFWERVVLSSREKRLFQMFGHDRSGMYRNNLVIISQGSLHLLADDGGVYPDDFFSFSKRATNVLSSWKPSFSLTCNLRMKPGIANNESVLATGVLGSFNSTGVKAIRSKEYQEKIFDSLKSDIR